MSCPTCESPVKHVKRLVKLPGDELCPNEQYDPCTDPWHDSIELMEEPTRNSESTATPEWVLRENSAREQRLKVKPELAQLFEYAQQKAKQDAEDITKPLILDFYRLRTNPEATLALIAERIEKQFPQGFTGCFKVTIERN